MARARILNSQLRQSLQTLAQLTLGALILILTFNIFMAPGKLAPGGVGGLSILINHYTGWPRGLTMLVLNLPILLMGFRNLGRMQFLTRTVYVVLVYNLGVDLLAPWMPNQGITDDLLLNAVYGGVVGGIGTGLVYRGRGTAAGTGVISRVAQLKTGIPISQLYVLIDGSIIFTVGITFGWVNALYALLMLFIWGLATDYILEGPSVVRTVFIVTDQAAEVSDRLFDRLGVGVTAWSGQGMYTEKPHMILFCTISRPDVNVLKSVVAQVDPRAFVVVGHGHQASGGVIRQAALEEST